MSLRSGGRQLSFELLAGDLTVDDADDTSPRSLPIGVPTRGAGSQLVNAACFLVPDVDARGNTVTHGFYPGSGRGAVRLAKECARALYYLAP